MFKLKAELQLSKPVKIDMASYVEHANKELFRKGVPKEQKGSQITEYKSEGGKIELTIEGTTYLRPHDALTRFKKYLSQELGKKEKIGVRSSSALEYIIEFETVQEAKEGIEVPYVDEVKIKGNKCTLSFKHLDDELLEKNYIDRIMNLVNDKIKNQYYEGKAEFREELWHSKEKQVIYKGDPAVDLEKAGWIRRSPGKAQFVLGREFTALMNTIKELMIKEVYEPQGFSEMTFPKFESWEIPKKSGHAANIYPNAYFVMTPKKADPKYWEGVIDHFKITGEIDKEGIIEKSDPVGIMSYAQCPPFWPYLERQTIDENSLPLKVYDWNGPTYRNEAGGTHGLDRVEEFHRVETLWVGTKQQEIEVWLQLKEAWQRFYDEVLDMEVKVSRVTPWWMAHAGMTTEAGTQETGTFDYDAYLPYRGDRKTEWLEIGNASSNGDKYPKAFSVKGRKEELWSGCCGASFERVIVAFLAQKGLDPKKWPEAVRKGFEKRAKGIKPIKFL